MSTVSYVYTTGSNPGYSFDLTTLTNGMMAIDIVSDPDENGVPRTAVPASVTVAGDYMEGSTALAAAQLAIESMGTGGLLVGDTTVDGDVTALTVSGAAVNDVLTVTDLSPVTLAWVAPTPSFTWNRITGTSQTLANNNGYVATNAGLTTFTIPTTANLGDTYKVYGDSASSFWKVESSTGNQQIRFGNQITTPIGNITSTARGDCVEIVCINATTPGAEIFGVMPGAVGELTIV